MGVQINGSEGNVIATKGTYSGNVKIGGTLTYEYVTNIDSVGLVTARNGIEIGARPGVAASISVDGNMIVSGISTFNDKVLLGTTTEGHSNADDLTIATSGHTGISLRSGTSNNGSVFFSDGTSGADEYRGWIQYTHTSDYLTFGTNADEKARIDSSGRVLIGHTASINVDAHLAALQVNGDNYSESTISIISNSSNSNGPYLFFAKQRSGSAGGTTIVQDGDTLGQIRFLGMDGTDYDNPAATIEVNCDGTPGGNDIPGRIKFSTGDGGSLTERLRITSGGQVNIGGDYTQTTYPLSVLGSTGGNGQINIVQRLKYSGDSNQYNNGTVIAFTNTNTNADAYSYIGARIDSGSSGANANALVFATNATNTAPTEKLRITSAGRVGIGENSPDALLHLSTGASATCELRLQANNTGSGAGDRGRINVYSSRNDGTEYQAGYVDIDRSSGTEDKAHLLVALNNGSGVGERVRITSGGSLLIGTTSTNYDELFTILEGGTDNEIATWRVNNASHNKDMMNMIHVAGSGSRVMIRFRRTGSLSSIGDITTSTTATSYGTNSDYRLKENEVLISDGITRLKELKPYRFNFKAEPDKTVDGFFAHEAKAVVPEAVTGEKDAVETTYYTEGDTIPDGKVVGDVKEENAIDPQGLDYAKLTPLLTAALQEAVTEIESLKARLDAAGL